MSITILLSLLVFSVVDANVLEHGKHKHSNNKPMSLLSECQNLNVLPSVHCGRTPTAVFANNAQLYVVFSQNGHIYFTTSTDNGKTYQLPTAVNPTPELIYDDGENRPKIVLGKNNEIYISWTHKTKGRYSGDVRFSRSLDGGKTFDKVTTINNNRDIISHRFEAMTVDSQGRIYLIWIDKRDQLEAKKIGQNYIGAALYYAVSNDQGKTFKANQKLFDNSCECCRIAIDNDTKGNVIALWRHIYPVNIRDHAISYIPYDTSVIRHQPMRINNDNWKIDGCPHHGPDLSIDDKNNAHMVWFTQGENNRGLMYGRFNFKNKRTEFKKTIDQSTTASRPQVHVINDNVFLMWKRFNGKSVELLNIYSIDRGKNWSKQKIIATTGNDSDHPDWVEKNGQLFASWHTQSEGLRLIPVVK